LALDALLTEEELFSSSLELKQIKYPHALCVSTCHNLAKPSSMGSEKEEQTESMSEDLCIEVSSPPGGQAQIT